ncbi:hypothetical protein TRIUR3_12544 [Triticum urartu]|uniref:DET1- and DDB1-associated protein 1 n=1 Tax=Triticum urartu TaxID=4572 RepID=M7ZVW3_TRIUA|nr:hypothetical protein TRIUR3_12544 [Triticum urartu]
MVMVYAKIRVPPDAQQQELFWPSPLALPPLMITTEPRNILLRHFYQNSENKPRPKRAAPESAALRNGKQARSPAEGGSQSSTRS